MPSCFSCVWFFVTPWTIARQAPLSMRILHARVLEWVAMPFSRRSSQPRGQTWVSRIVGRFFTASATWKTPPKRRILPTPRLMKRTHKLLDMRGSRSWSWASTSPLCSLLWKLIFKADYSQRKGIVCSVLPHWESKVTYDITFPATDNHVCSTTFPI